MEPGTSKKPWFKPRFFSSKKALCSWHAFPSWGVSDAEMRLAQMIRLVDDYSWFDPTALEGFVEEAVAILGENPALIDRLDAVAEAVRWRIGRILAML